MSGLTDEQRAELAEALVRSWPMPTRVDDVAPIVARMLADERERIAQAIEAPPTASWLGNRQAQVGWEFAMDEAARIARGGAA